MAEISSVLATPPCFKYKGREYKVCKRDFEIEALCERKVEENALESIKSFRGKMSPVDYQMQMDGWRRDVATNVYSFGSPVFIQWLLSSEGMKYMAYLQLKKLNPEVTLELIDEVYEDDEAWVELQEVMAQAEQDPTPAQTGN